MKIDNDRFPLANQRVRNPLPDHDLQRNSSASSGFTSNGLGGHTRPAYASLTGSLHGIEIIHPSAGRTLPIPETKRPKLFRAMRRSLNSPPPKSLLDYPSRLLKRNAWFLWVTSVARPETLPDLGSMVSKVSVSLPRRSHSQISEHEPKQLLGEWDVQRLTTLTGVWRVSFSSLSVNWSHGSHRPQNPVQPLSLRGYPEWCSFTCFSPEKAHDWRHSLHYNVTGGRECPAHRQLVSLALAFRPKHHHRKQQRNFSRWRSLSKTRSQVSRRTKTRSSTAKS